MLVTQAFDGAGREFHGPTPRAAVILLVAVIVAVALVWLAASWAFEQWALANPIAVPTTMPGFILR